MISYLLKLVENLWYLALLIVVIKLNSLYLFQGQMREILRLHEKYCTAQAYDSMPIKGEYLRNRQLHISTNGHKVSTLRQAQHTNFG